MACTHLAILVGTLLLLTSLILVNKSFANSALGEVRNILNFTGGKLNSRLSQINTSSIPMIISAAILMIVIDYSISGNWHTAPVYATLGCVALGIALVVKILNYTSDNGDMQTSDPLNMHEDSIPQAKF